MASRRIVCAMSFGYSMHWTILGFLIGRSLPMQASDWLIFAPDDGPLWPVITFYTCHEVRRDQTK